MDVQELRQLEARMLFPGEVTDNIIDHLHDDTESLQATALVSRSWLLSSQHHLFLTTSCQLTVPGRHLTDFLVWLSTAKYAKTQISTFVVEGDRTMDHSRNRPKTSVQDLENAILQLPSLVALNVRRATLTSRVRNDEVYRPSTRQALGTLGMLFLATEDNHFKPILELLSLFSEVEHLTACHLECLWAPNTVMAPSTLVNTPPYYNAVRVSGLSLKDDYPYERWNGYQGIVQLSHDSPSSWQLKEVSLMFPAMTLHGVLNDLLPACKNSLIHLTIRLPTYSFMAPGGSTVAPRWPGPDLHQCGSLESLEFMIEIVPTVDMDTISPMLYERSLALHSEMLLTAPRSLRTVKIVFGYSEHYDPATTQSFARLSNWSMLDDALRYLAQVDVVCVIEKLNYSFLAKDEMSHRRFPDAWRGAVHDEADPRVRLLKKMLPKAQAGKQLTFLVMSPWIATDAVPDVAASSNTVIEH